MGRRKHQRWWLFHEMQRNDQCLFVPIFIRSPLGNKIFIKGRFVNFYGRSRCLQITAAGHDRLRHRQNIGTLSGPKRILTSKITEPPRNNSSTLNSRHIIKPKKYAWCGFQHMVKTRTNWTVGQRMDWWV